MKNLLCAFATLGVVSLAPPSASAADLGGYEERETYVERPARIIERIVEHRFYEPRYYEESEVYYVPRRRVYHYDAGGYPYYYGRRFFHRRHHDGRGYERW